MPCASRSFMMALWVSLLALCWQHDDEEANRKECSSFLWLVVACATAGALFGLLCLPKLGSCCNFLFKSSAMSSETISIGSQEVMQWPTLLPLTCCYELHRLGDSYNDASRMWAPVSDQSPSSIVEVGCGMGCFAIFVHNTHMSLVDFSPFYCNMHTTWWILAAVSRPSKQQFEELDAITTSTTTSYHCTSQCRAITLFQWILWCRCVHELFPGITHHGMREGLMEMAHVMKPGDVAFWASPTDALFPSDIAAAVAGHHKGCVMPRASSADNLEIDMATHTLIPFVFLLLFQWQLCMPSLHKCFPLPLADVA